ncbi:MAG: hypothetical protein JOZ12_04380 [Sinobacteraceae bacterium]|nr:hypothetical protein [Nevskiaceae bacterium]MBV8853098.1 hypothetical protein [Nevskiaceae bacterium]MBV9914825.1 hypothetical protein [Nevskiaceae bacterium]
MIFTIALGVVTASAIAGLYLLARVVNLLDQINRRLGDSSARPPPDGRIDRSDRS